MHHTDLDRRRPDSDPPAASGPAPVRQRHARERHADYGPADEHLCQRFGCPTGRVIEPERDTRPVIEPGRHADSGPDLHGNGYARGAHALRDSDTESLAKPQPIGIAQPEPEPESGGHSDSHHAGSPIGPEPESEPQSEA